MSDKTDFLNLPKVELHLHLDCSLSYAVVNKIDAAITEQEYAQSFIAPPKCKDLSDYLTRALKGINLMQTAEALHLATLDLFQQLKADKVVYAEIRFAPLEHLRNGLSPADVVQTVSHALAEGIQQTGIQAGLILCTLRHYDKAQSMKTVKLAEQFQQEHVVGFDIAGDEALFSLDNHLAAFQYAHAIGLPCTAHAGEACGPESVWETLEQLKPRRIGHGVRSMEDPRLIDTLRHNNIHLEVCPTSNIQTNVYADMANHAIDKLFHAGLSIGVNTDARAISNVDLNTEYKKLNQAFSWTKADFLKCNLDALKQAFASEEIKTKIRSKFFC